MNVELLFPSKYIKAADLKGKAAAVTIQRFSVEDLFATNGTSERKGVISFEGHKKLFVLGTKLNKRVLVHLFGPETDDWIGKQIVLYPSKDTAFGKVVDCLRIRSVNPDDMRGFTCGNPYYMRDLEAWLAECDKKEAS